MSDVLLTVSGVIPDDIAAQIARGERPRADYLELARAFDADLLDYAAARREAGRVGKLIERLAGPNMLLAWACFERRNRYRAIVTDGEQVGLPLALLFHTLLGARRPKHAMITHVISVPKKMLLLDRLGAARGIDQFFVYSTWQKRFIEARWNIAPERVVFTPFMVDAQFFAPGHARSTNTARLICSAGLERRDYATLLEAVRGLDVQVTIAAASPWSKRADGTAGQALPPNVNVCRLSQFELRQLYADSRFVVMPLEPVNFQAGVTAILEAMAMERAVICTLVPGQTDVVVEGETGLYVPPGNAEAMRAAIKYLLANPAEAARMGRAGRHRAEALMSLDRYATRLNQYVRAGTNRAELSRELGASEQ